jgi:hypothetical protein
MNMPALQSTFGDISDPRNRAIAFLSGGKPACISTDLYHGKALDTYTGMSTRLTKYYPYQAEVDHIRDAAQDGTIAPYIEHGHTFAIIGGAAAVKEKEMVLVEELIKKDPSKERRIISIDENAEPNEEQCIPAIEEVLKRLNSEIPGGHNTRLEPAINASIHNLTQQQLEFIHQGDVIGSSMGGTAFNPEGVAPLHYPDYEVRQFFNAMAAVVSNPKTTDNRLITGYNNTKNAKKIRDAYTEKPDGDDKYSSERFFILGIWQLLQKIEGIDDYNEEDFSNGITVESLINKFAQKYRVDDDVSISNNGLITTKKFTIRVPRPDNSFWQRTFQQGDILTVINAAHPVETKLDDMVRDLDFPMEGIATLKQPQNGSVLHVFSAPPKSRVISPAPSN